MDVLLGTVRVLQSGVQRQLVGACLSGSLRESWVGCSSCQLSSWLHLLPCACWFCHPLDFQGSSLWSSSHSSSGGRAHRCWSSFQIPEWVWASITIKTWLSFRSVLVGWISPFGVLLVLPLTSSVDFRQALLPRRPLCNLNLATAILLLLALYLLPLFSCLSLFPDHRFGNHSRPVLRFGFQPALPVCLVGTSVEQREQSELGQQVLGQHPCCVVRLGAQIGLLLSAWATEFGLWHGATVWTAHVFTTPLRLSSVQLEEFLGHPLFATALQAGWRQRSTWQQLVWNTHRRQTRRDGVWRHHPYGCWLRAIRARAASFGRCGGWFSFGNSIGLPQERFRSSTCFAKRILARGHLRDGATWQVQTICWARQRL